MKCLQVKHDLIPMFCTLQRTLVSEVVFCLVSQFFQIWQTGILDHGRRTTEDNEDITGWDREMLFDHVVGHKS